jgi:hypothetical protein
MCYRDPLMAERKLEDVQVRRDCLHHLELCTFTFHVAVYRNKELEQVVSLSDCVNYFRMNFKDCVFVYYNVIILYVICR